MLTLPERFGLPDRYDEGFMYHATHGIKIHSIQRLGLQGHRTGRQLPSQRNFFGGNAEKLMRAYATDVVDLLQDEEPYKYFQGSSEALHYGCCILRAQTIMLRKKYNFTNGYGFVLEGTNTVSSSDLEVFIDAKWQNLELASLGRPQYLRSLTYKVFEAYGR